MTHKEPPFSYCLDFSKEDCENIKEDVKWKALWLNTHLFQSIFGELLHRWKQTSLNKEDKDTRVSQDILENEF